LHQLYNHKTVRKRQKLSSGNNRDTDEDSNQKIAAGKQGKMLVGEHFSLEQMTESAMKELEKYKSQLLEHLGDANGETACPEFLKCLDKLQDFKESLPQEVQYELGRADIKQLDGVWMVLSKPNFPECLGKSANDKYMYTLGRMSFDMFKPIDLVCTIQDMYTTVLEVDSMSRVPSSLRQEVTRRNCPISCYK